MTSDSRDGKEKLQPKRPKPAIQGINASSLLGLKAQLARKQQQVKNHGPASAGVDGTARKTAGIDLSNIGNRGVKTRDAQDRKIPTTEDQKLAYSARKLQAKEKLYDELASGRAAPSDDYDVDFTQQARHLPPLQHALRREHPPSPRPRSASRSASPADGSGCAKQRASPTYEPYHKAHPEEIGSKGEWEAGASDCGAHVSCHEDSEPQWPVSRGTRDAHTTERDEQHAALVGRKARARWLNEKMEQLEAEEKVEQQRRQTRKDLEEQVASEVAKGAVKRQTELDAKREQQAEVKRRLVERLVDRRMLKMKQDTEKVLDAKIPPK